MAMETIKGFLIKGVEQLQRHIPEIEHLFAECANEHRIPEVENLFKDSSIHQSEDETSEDDKIRSDQKEQVQSAEKQEITDPKPGACKQQKHTPHPLWDGNSERLPTLPQNNWCYFNDNWDPKYPEVDVWDEGGVAKVDYSDNVLLIHDCPYCYGTKLCGHCIRSKECEEIFKPNDEVGYRGIRHMRRVSRHFLDVASKVRTMDERTRGIVRKIARNNFYARWLDTVPHEKRKIYKEKFSEVWLFFKYLRSGKIPYLLSAHAGNQSINAEHGGKNYSNSRDGTQTVKQAFEISGSEQFQEIVDIVVEFYNKCGDYKRSLVCEFIDSIRTKIGKCFSWIKYIINTTFEKVFHELENSIHRIFLSDTPSSKHWRKFVCILTVSALVSLGVCTEKFFLCLVNFTLFVTLGADCMGECKSKFPFTNVKDVSYMTEQEQDSLILLMMTYQSVTRRTIDFSSTIEEFLLNLQESSFDVIGTIISLCIGFFGPFSDLYSVDHLLKTLTSTFTFGTSLQNFSAQIGHLLPIGTMSYLNNKLSGPNYGIWDWIILAKAFDDVSDEPSILTSVGFAKDLYQCLQSGRVFVQDMFAPIVWTSFVSLFSKLEKLQAHLYEIHVLKIQVGSEQAVEDQIVSSEIKGQDGDLKPELKLQSELVSEHDDTLEELEQQSCPLDEEQIPNISEQVESHDKSDLKLVHETIGHKENELPSIKEEDDELNGCEPEFQETCSRFEDHEYQDIGPQYDEQSTEMVAYCPDYQALPLKCEEIQRKFLEDSIEILPCVYTFSFWLESFMVGLFYSISFTLGIIFAGMLSLVVCLIQKIIQILKNKKLLQTTEQVYSQEVQLKSHNSEARSQTTTNMAEQLLLSNGNNLSPLQSPIIVELLSRPETERQDMLRTVEEKSTVRDGNVGEDLTYSTLMVGKNEARCVNLGYGWFMTYYHGLDYLIKKSRNIEINDGHSSVTVDFSSVVIVTDKINDFVVFRIPFNVKEPICKNLIDEFINLDELMEFRSFPVTMVKKEGNSSGIAVIKSGRPYCTDSGEKFHHDVALMTDIKSYKGDCGYLVKVSSGKHQGKYVGMNVAGTGVGIVDARSMTSIVTKEKLIQATSASAFSLEAHSFQFNGSEQHYDEQTPFKILEEGIDWNSSLIFYDESTIEEVEFFAHSMEPNKELIRTSVEEPAKCPTIQATRGLVSLHTSQLTSQDHLAQRTEGLQDATCESPMDMNYGVDSTIVRKQIQWTVHNSINTHILSIKNLPWDLLSMGNQDNLQNMPFNRFTFWHGDIELTFQVNGTPFQQGKLVAYFMPLTNSPVDDVVNVQSAIHVKILPNRNTTARLRIPYRFPRTYMLTSSNDNLGSLHIMVYSPLRSKQQTSCTITVYSSFPQSTFILPRPTSIFGDGKSDECEEFEAHGNTTSTTRIGTVYGQMTNETQGGNKSRADVAMDNPSLCSGGIPVMQQFNGLAKSVGTETTTAMQCNPSATYMHSHRYLDQTETTIQFLCSRLGVINTCTLATSDNVDDVLFQFPLNSLFRVPSTYWDGRQSVNYPIAVAVINHFHFWRADIILTFELIRNDFQTTRLRGVMAYGASEFAAKDKDIFYNEVMDFTAEKDTHTLIIPYNAVVEYLRTYDGISSFPKADYSLGVFALMVANELTAPSTTVVNQVQVITSVSFRNVGVACPRAVPYIPLAYDTYQRGSHSTRLYIQHNAPITKKLEDEDFDFCAHMMSDIDPREGEPSDPIEGATGASGHDAPKPKIITDDCTPEFNEAARTKHKKKFPYVIRDIYDLVRRGRPYFEPVRRSHYAGWIGPSRMTAVEYFMVKPTVPFMGVFAAWSGELRYRIYLGNESGIFNTVLFQPIPFVSNDENNFMVPGVIQKKTAWEGKNVVKPSGDTEQYLSRGSGTSIPIPSGAIEIPYSVSADKSFIDVQIPFMTHFNFLWTEEDADKINRDRQYLGKLIIIRGLPSTAGRSKPFPEDLNTIFVSGADSFRLGIFRPPESCVPISVKDNAASPVGKGVYRVYGYGYNLGKTR